MGFHNYSFIFHFEKSLTTSGVSQYFNDHITDVFIYSTCYVCGIFTLKSFMRTRERCDLQYVLTVWNISLAFFSMFAFIRTAPEVISGIQTLGLSMNLLCSTEFLSGHVPEFWISMYSISKLIELGDTLFIILRKRKLLFLHWYHHVTMVLSSWCFFDDTFGMRGFIVVATYGLHGIMYTYFALETLRIHIPFAVRIGLTSLQIVMMITGFTVALLSFVAPMAVPGCLINTFASGFIMVQALSYSVLFLDLFFVTFVLPKLDKTL